MSRHVIAGGMAMVVVGVELCIAARPGPPLGRLPGDIDLKDESGSLYGPIGSSIILSLILTPTLDVILRTLRK